MFFLGKWGSNSKDHRIIGSYRRRRRRPKDHRIIPPPKAAAKGSVRRGQRISLSYQNTGPTILSHGDLSRVSWHSINMAEQYQISTHFCGFLRGRGSGVIFIVAGHGHHKSLQGGNSSMFFEKHIFQKFNFVPRRGERNTTSYLLNI